MANFQNNAITESGILLRSHVDMGAVFTATKIVIGSGYIPAGKTAKTMTDVVSPVKELAINKKERTPDGKVVFGGVYTNEDIATEFYFRELALYAKAVYPDGTEVAEVLYSYGNASSGAELMAAYSTSTVVERQMDIVTFLSNDAAVDLTIESGMYMTQDQAKKAFAPSGGGYGDELAQISATSAGQDIQDFCRGFDEIIDKMDIATTCQIGVSVPWAFGSGYYLATIYKYSAKYSVVVASSTPIQGTAYGWKIAKEDETWGEVEWINAPMKVNVEFRTTERIDGKVVYKKNVSGVIQYRLDGEATWKNYAEAVGAVSKTGDQTMTGNLTMRTLGVTDGYMNGSVSTDGATSRVQILARNPNTGKAGAILVGPDGIHFMDGSGYEYRVIHEGNMAQFLGVAPATVE